ncbi:hypothetical protein ACLOJK_027238, partial [Asimina triloba]
LETSTIAMGGIVSMIVICLGISLESPVHTRALGNDRINLNTLVFMKLCQKEGERYLIVNNEGTFVPPSYPLQDDRAEPSIPSQHGSNAAEQSQSQPCLVNLEMIMGALNTTNAKLKSIVNEMREYHASMSLKLASIEIRLDALCAD